jgi:hypothetical protein
MVFAKFSPADASSEGEKTTTGTDVVARALDRKVRDFAAAPLAVKEARIKDLVEFITNNATKGLSINKMP